MKLNDVEVTVRNRKGRFKGVRIKKGSEQYRSPGMLETANDRFRAAEECLNRSDFAGAIREAQTCVELSVKALLEILGIVYKPKHDVSDKIPAIIDKLKHWLGNDEVLAVENCLVPEEVWMKILVAMRSIATYGEQKLNIGADVIFSNESNKELVKLSVRETEKIYNTIAELIKKLVKLQAESSFVVNKKMSTVKFILQKFFELVETPIKSNWSIRILHPNETIDKCIVLYNGNRLPWWDSEECYYERSIERGGGGNVRIPIEIEREDAEVRIMDGEKTLKQVKFRDITVSKP
jgi:hypothetical protein